MDDILQAKQNKYRTGFHKTPLMIAWLPLINLAVLVAAMRWYKYSFYLHVLLAIAVITLTLLSTIHILVDDWVTPNDFIQIQKIHNIAGLAIVIGLGLQILSGLLSRVVQYSPRLRVSTCVYIKKFHQYSGYLMMLASKFDYLNVKYMRGKYDDFVLFIVIQLLCLLIYLWIKKSSWTLGQDMVDGQLISPVKEDKNNIIQHFFVWVKSKIVNVKKQIQQNSAILPSIQKRLNILLSQKQISIQNYVLFNDFVYDISKIKYLHPGGQRVVELMRNREVNRFMYGFYKIEDDSQAPLHNHTKESMRICGEPIAKIQRISPIEGFQTYAKFTIAESKRINAGTSVYVVYLRPKLQSNSQIFNLKYTGYKNQSQIGQYFSLTICDSKGRKRCTRLYTTAWCIRPHNIDFMERHSPNSTKLIISEFDPQNYKKQTNFSITQSLLKSSTNSSLTQFDRKEEIITIIMKKYSKGELTSRFLANKFKGEIIVSAPMGAGMNYQNLRDDGKVIIVCGGTGVLPFCDLIDLLFKRVKYLQSPHFVSQILSSDELITQDLIKKRKFVFYYAAESSYDTIPMIFYQLNYLCSCSAYIDFEVVLKIKRDSGLLRKDYKLFKYQSQSFNKQIQETIRNERENINKIYVCGPFKMNQQMLKLFKNNHLSQELYDFM